MNFDDIQSAWNNDNDNSKVVIPSSVDQLKSLQMPVEKLRKNMQLEFYVQFGSLLLCAFLPKMFYLSPVMIAPFYAMYLVVIAISVHYFYKFYLFYNSLRTNTLSSKDNLYSLYYEAKLNIEMYKAYTYTLFPFALIIAVMFMASDKANKAAIVLEQALVHKGMAIGIAVTFVILILMIMMITESWIKKYYGKYLTQIGQVLDQFKENA
ncbi:hypothetical protein [Chitinophaga arvensicola]|uniref:Uncharacterized protein n=1 Tax=Chitinophaga arvensicola TaxID=29529 RepID=A0A1I0SDH8_9BACT|nr:hypothetical protein [Chitinophaga arvensicola]SEW55917.1 hypothetical protein SAMN04488122_6513 [Chitinophaga arvensicola]